MLYNYKNLTLTLKLCPRDIILDSSLAASFFSATFKMRNGLMTNPLYQNLLVTSNTLRNWSPYSARMNDGGRKSFWNWTARCNVIWSWNEERCHRLQVCYFSRYIPMKSICWPKTEFPSRANRPPYLNQGAKMAPSAMLLGND